MKKLSDNRNGVVYKTGNKGFSVKNAALQIMRELIIRGIVHEYDRANTGSVYITCDSDNIVEIRISNHTKRQLNDDEIDTIKVSTLNTKSGLIKSTKINVVDTSSKNEALEAIRNNLIIF